MPRSSPGSTSSRPRPPSRCSCSATTIRGIPRPDPAETYFGINPDDSEALARRDRAGGDAIAGYFAGHTHRNRVRRFAGTRDVPIVEVACVKDYPGRVGRVPRATRAGYTQVVRRIGGTGRPGVDGARRRTMIQGSTATSSSARCDDRCFTQRF